MNKEQHIKWYMELCNQEYFGDFKSFDANIKMQESGLYLN